MITLSCKTGQTIAVLGIGGSGLYVIEALIAGGATVWASDDNADQCEKAAEIGAIIVDLATINWGEVDEFVIAPGVPLTHPEPHWSVDLAHQAGVPIIGDIELFYAQYKYENWKDKYENWNVPIVAITGTNGKSTTTALICHMLETAGRSVQMGGNIGRAVLSLDAPKPDTVYVVEVSSYQIDLAPSFSPDVGLLLNITPDHIDRHGTLDNYAAIKERMIVASKKAVIAIDDPLTEAIAVRAVARGQDLDLILSQQDMQSSLQANWTLSHDDIILSENDDVTKIASLAGIKIASLAGITSLRGGHNAQNAVMACAALSSLGITKEELQTGLATFPGLAHRMEPIQKGNWLFINDSKATNAEATSKALKSFERVYWIAGGVPKEGGIKTLKPYFKHIIHTYLIGQAAEEFGQTLQDENVPFTKSGDLSNALAACWSDIQDSKDTKAVILFSPACASFDQFDNFEKRGEAFKAEVDMLAQSSPDLMKEVS